MKRNVLNLLLALFFLTLQIPTSIAASFDCTKAGTQVERLICSTPILGELDVALSTNYKNIRASNIGDGARADLLQTQREWMQQRNTCSNAACVERIYRKRLDEICSYPVLTGMHPPCKYSADIGKQPTANNQPNERSDLRNDPVWISGFGQGNLEYFIDIEKIRFYIGCPTKNGSSSMSSSVSLTDNGREVKTFTIQLGPHLLNGPFSADSRVGDANFIFLLENLRKYDLLLSFNNKKIKIFRSNAAEIIPSYDSKSFDCNLSSNVENIQPNESSASRAPPQPRASAPQASNSGNKEFTTAEKAGICAGYHSGYAIMSDRFGSRNDRDHSVNVVTQLDARYGSSSSYKPMKDFAFKTLTEALKNKNTSVFAGMIAICKQIGAPTPINTGR